MSLLKQYLEHKIQSKIGLNFAVFAGVFVALMAMILALTFGVVAAFIELSQQYSLLISSLILFGTFVAVALVATIFVITARRNAILAAERALGQEAAAATVVQPAYLNTVLLNTVLLIGNQIGWRRLIPIAGVGLLAVGMAREWGGRSRPDPSDEI